VDDEPAPTGLHTYAAITGEKIAMSPDSKQRVKVTVNDKLYEVEVGDLAVSPITVHVNGRPYRVYIETGEVERVPADAPVTDPKTEGPPTSRPEKASAPTGPAGQQVGVVKAPMPGNILDIAVKPGDRVAVRQQLCSLEAMKMKNAIRSPGEGIIASVEVAEGQAVAHGDVLFTFE
jgi:biotin carboxyl carrier protein